MLKLLIRQAAFLIALTGLQREFQSDRIDDAEMVVRDLSKRRICSGEDGENLN
jgi:hypothetical protein